MDIRNFFLLTIWLVGASELHASSPGVSSNWSTNVSKLMAKSHNLGPGHVVPELGPIYVEVVKARMNSPEFLLGTQEVVQLCLRQDDTWKNFCNGLIQGYAESANFTQRSCIPSGTKRRSLVEIFIQPEIVVFSGYIDDWPAIDSAAEIFAKYFPCS